MAGNKNDQGSKEEIAEGMSEAGKGQDAGGIATHIFEQDGGKLRLKLHTFN